MPITVGNVLKFQLQEDINGVVSDVVGFSEVEIVRKEFNGEEFSGVGYQRILIQDNYGTLGNHGIGQSVTGNALQVTSKALALPMYRFDFAFVLTNQRLKEVYELFLAMYNLRAEGRNVRLKMTDDRLRISEPLDPFASNARPGTDLTTTLANIQYQLKTVEYQISWENFEWRHLVGDLYTVNILGNELEILTDANSGNECAVAEPETIDPVDGFTLNAIKLPSNILSATTIDCFAIGVQPTTTTFDNQYFAHWEIDGEEVFNIWDQFTPGAFGNQVIRYDTDFPDATWKGDTGIRNTRVLSDRLQCIDTDPENTGYFIREYRPNCTLGASPFQEESEVFPLLGVFSATNVDEFQFIIDNEDFQQTFLLPRLINSSGAITSPSNGAVIEQFYFQNPDNLEFPRRKPISEWADEEVGEELYLTSSAVSEDDGITLTPIFNVDQFGWFWFGYQLNMDATTEFELEFDFKIDGNALGAEGFALIFHDDPRGTDYDGYGTLFPAPGSNIAFGGTPSFFGGYDANVAVTPSIAVAFDTFQSFNDGQALENPTGTALPHVLHVVRDGNLEVAGATGRIVNNLAIDQTIRGQTINVKVTYSAVTDILNIDFTFEDTLIQNIVVPSVPIFTAVGSKAWIGFSARSGGTGLPGFENDDRHKIKSFRMRHNSTWRVPNTNTNFFASYIAFDLLNDQLQNRYKISMGTETNDLFRDVVTVRSPVEGNNFFYHICHDPADANNGAVYRTIGPDFFSTSRSLIRSVTDGSIPVLKNAIAHPTEYKFYLTQGADSGDVYVTSNWTSYTLIGSWGEKDAAVENEGQLYWFRNRYLIRSPNTFVVDSLNEIFVNLSTLVCSADVGSDDYNDIFGAGREIIAITPTLDYNSNYVANGNEQIIVVSRDSTTEDQPVVVVFEPTEVCA